MYISAYIYVIVCLLAVMVIVLSTYRAEKSKMPNRVRGIGLSVALLMITGAGIYALLADREDDVSGFPLIIILSIVIGGMITVRGIVRYASKMRRPYALPTIIVGMAIALIPILIYFLINLIN